MTNHINDPVGAHAASAISYAGGPPWADLTANPASNAEAQLDKLVTDLSTGDGANKLHYNGVGSGFADSTGFAAAPLGLAIDNIASILGNPGLPDGASKIGVRTIVNSPITISGGTLRSFLTTLALATGIKYSSASTFRNGDTLADASVQTTIDAIVSEYNSALVGNSGARNIGMELRTSWLDGTSNPLGSIYDSVNKIITDLNLQTVNLSGAQKVGIDARANWLDGTTNVATSVAAAVKKIITDLSDQTSVGANGASRIGFAPQGNLSANTVETALAELDTEKGGLALANTWTNNNTWSAAGTALVYTNGLRVGASGDYGFVSSRNIGNMIQTSPTVLSGTNWTRDNAGLFVGDAGDALIQPLDVPDGTTLSTITASFIAPTGHTGIPLQTSFIGVYYLDITTATRTLIQGASYTAGTLANYNNGTIKTVFANLLSHVVDKTNRRYYAFFQCESSTNSLNGTTYVGSQLAATTSKVRYD